jgi:hypothetical protein
MEELKNLSRPELELALKVLAESEEDEERLYLRVPQQLSHLKQLDWLAVGSLLNLIELQKRNSPLQ